MWSIFILMTVTWHPEPDIEVAGGPSLYSESVEFEPLTLTWSPSEGFGARTRAVVYSKP